MMRRAFVGSAIFAGVGLGLGFGFGCSSVSTPAPSPPTEVNVSTTADGGADVPDAKIDGSIEGRTDGGAGVIIAARPYHFKAPKGYDKAKPAPLVVLLHGYGVDGPTQDTYFKLGELADEKTFLYAFPDGTLDSFGKRFWSASDACCNFFQDPVDDIAYVNAIIDDVSAKYSVDAKRVFVVGHSNGGFMAHRVACELSPRVAAIVSLAGMAWKDPSRCKPTEHVAVLQVQGDADETIFYDGGTVSSTVPPYPSSRETVAGWAMRNGCTGGLGSGPAMDLESKIAGAETKVEPYLACSGANVELWTIAGGKHVPDLQPEWAASIYKFLMANPKK